MPYTTKALVRENLLQKREFFTGLTGTDITFSDNFTESLTTVKKNGTSVTGTTFIPPNIARLSGAAIAADYFEVQRAVLLSDSELDNIIGYVDSLINSKLAKAYTLPLSETPKVLETKATLMCQSLAQKQLSRHSEYNVHPSEVEQADKDLKECMRWLDDLVDPNEPGSELVKADNTVIARFADFSENTVHVGMDDSTEEV